MFEKKVCTSGNIGLDFIVFQSWQQNQTFPFLKQAISHQICVANTIYHNYFCVEHIIFSIPISNLMSSLR